MSRITGLTRLGLVVLLAAAPIAGAAVLQTPAAQAQTSAKDEKSREITNHKDGTKRNVSVSVSQTANLVDRQQVRIDLKGFVPSRNANNITLNGTKVEYPVVVMQCRGDNPDRSACVNEDRVQWQAGWDVDAPPAQRAVADKQSRPGEVGVYPGAPDYETQLGNLLRAEQLPYVSVDNVSYLWVNTLGTDGEPIIDTPTVKSFPPTDVTSGEGAATVNTRNIPIRANGTNSFLFEPRQKASQASLGCSDTQKCSIVVVPVMDMACRPEAAQNDYAKACGGDAVGPVAGDPTSSETYNYFTTAKLWLAESNWANKIVFPITFLPDLQTCDVRGDHANIPAYGSELVSVAQERWGAAYCTGARQSDYLPVYSQGSEYFARRQFTTKLGAAYQQNAVFVTQPVTESPRPVAHAPTAISGFTVAFTIDDGNGAQVQNLTLSPRLLAKLITQSYNPAFLSANERQGRRPYDGEQQITDQNRGDYYVGHPALLNNPMSLFADPEFADLNPSVVLKSGTLPLALHLGGTVNPVMFTIDSDVTMELTRYITSDPVARAWLDGQPDPYGMRVNPAWMHLQPTQIYTMLDSWVKTPSPRKPAWLETSGPTNDRFFIRGGGDTCDEMHQTPYLTRVSNVEISARKAALALLDRRGSATPDCSWTQVPVPPKEQDPKPQFPGDVVDQTVWYTEAKKPSADFGRRAMLAVTTVANARLYELPTAKLVNAGGKAVAPTPGTMVNALKTATVDQASGTIQLDHKQLTNAYQYPGTMVAYLAAPTSGLDAQLARRYADYIEFMATAGQVPGATLANLPPGYDPLPPALVKQAKDAAAAVRAQRGEVPPPPGDPLGDGTSDLGDPAPLADNPGNGLPVTPAGATQNDSKDGDPEQVAKTQSDSSWLARWAIPLLVGFGLLAAAVAFAVQVGSQPEHPLRRGLDSVLKAVGRR